MNNILSIRERLGMSQADFASDIEVTQGSVSHYECNRQEVSPAVARRVIDISAKRGLNISFDDVYSERGTDKAA